MGRELSLRRQAANARQRAAARDTRPHAYYLRAMGMSFFRQKAVLCER